MADEKGAATSVPTAASKPASPAMNIPRPVVPTAALRPVAQNGNTAQASMAAYGGVPGARADLIYGATNTTKTSQLGWAAEWIRSRFGKRSRLVSADPGGWETIQSLVDDGTIDAFALIQHRTNVYETMEKLCLGWWPQDVRDPQSKLVAPAQNGLKDVGGMFFEGLTSWCDIMMRTNVTDLKNINVPRSAAEKENLLVSGDFVHRYSSQTDYGSIQDIIAEFVRDSAMLPVLKCIWTALELKSEDKKTNLVTYGPNIIGQKATANCGPWFGAMLHMDFLPGIVEITDPTNPQAKLRIEKLKPFLFTRNHIDPQDQSKRSWPAKPRAPKTMWHKVPDVMPPRADHYYELMAGLLEEEKASRIAASPKT